MLLVEGRGSVETCKLTQPRQWNTMISYENSCANRISTSFFSHECRELFEFWDSMRLSEYGVKSSRKSDFTKLRIPFPCFKISPLSDLARYEHTGVSKNRGTPKWMVYNGKPCKIDDLGVPLIFGNIHIVIVSLERNAIRNFVNRHFWRQKFQLLFKNHTRKKCLEHMYSKALSHYSKIPWGIPSAK